MDEPTVEITADHLVVDDEESTNGLEDVIDWRTLEDLILSGVLRSRKDVRKRIRNDLESAGWSATHRMMEHAINGMFPEYREMYYQLPLGYGVSKDQRDRLSKLDWQQVKAIRLRYNLGDPVPHLASEYGVKRGTVYDIVNHRTWKESNAA